MMHLQGESDLESSGKTVAELLLSHAHFKQGRREVAGSISSAQRKYAERKRQKKRLMFEGKRDWSKAKKLRVRKSASSEHQEMWD